METLSGDSFDGNITSGENRSFWISTGESLVYKQLDNNIETDVLVVGGGISGLTAAYCLLKSGHEVVLVEDGYIGSGETGRTTAHLSYALDDHYYEIEKLFGDEKAQLAAESHISAIGFIEKTVFLENIDCNFKRINGYLFPGHGDKYETLEKEFIATRKAGLDTVLLNQIPGMSSSGDGSCLMFPDQAQFHPMEYIKGLADAIIAGGGLIFTETRAEEFFRDGVRANGFTISAKSIVVATNTPVNDLVTIHTKQYAYRTYVVAMSIPKGSLPYALWWDTGDMGSMWESKPYHYVRLQELDENSDLLIVGGEDHRVGQAYEEELAPELRYERLINWAGDKFPQVEKVLYKWSGQVMEPIDAMAFIGKNPGDDNIYIITGDSGNGMTHGTIGGLLVTDLINGFENPWEELYDPSRITVKAAGEFLKEAGNMAAQYTDWVREGDIESVYDLIPGDGGILSQGFKKYTVYRDASGRVHTCSATCPHLGGILTWNPDEKSFDCPVHGSRFTAEGKVINGPAISDLKRVTVREEAKKPGERSD
jgi:glycine/D-amino acid oxidase-like deaminating enzyme/nitrite reductase/ring-hydroxylating ferredoxin subunit